FILKLSNGKRVAIISDFDILFSTRSRLGPMNLKQAKLVTSRSVSSDYLRSTRVMYYEVSK
ncbi:MAG: hypothetical protein MUO85_10850, partial [candidate division Zixibacteria bacterium]|nr:hypothetical protein [candidate division Zixibacteria bacterium]